MEMCDGEMVATPPEDPESWLHASMKLWPGNRQSRELCTGLMVVLVSCSPERRNCGQEVEHEPRPSEPALESYDGGRLSTSDLGEVASREPWSISSHPLGLWLSAKLQMCPGKCSFKLAKETLSFLGVGAGSALGS